MVMSCFRILNSLSLGFSPSAAHTYPSKVLAWRILFDFPHKRTKGRSSDLHYNYSRNDNNNNITVLD